jgi:response regulator RpfG family c-di-GMP phosphodiesterase
MAIEQRDPTTKGHSERVAKLTLCLAAVVDRADSGRLAEVRFDKDELRELEYAALLHDFGKVSVSEDVLVKADKLHPKQFERIMSRLDHMRTAIRMDLLQRRLRGEDIDEREFERNLRRELAEVDELQRLVIAANKPTILDADKSASIHALAEREFDGGHRRIRLLDPADVESLLIPRGSLTIEERETIQQHVVDTVKFLEQIPWGRKLSRVADIAGKHHEYLDGSGYPHGIGADQIPVQARMMTIADIFDALTAADRPYKSAVPLQRALSILEMEVDKGKLDRDLFTAFVEGEVFREITLARA